VWTTKLSSPHAKVARLRQLLATW